MGIVEPVRGLGIVRRGCGLGKIFGSQEDWGSGVGQGVGGVGDGGDWASRMASKHNTARVFAVKNGRPVAVLSLEYKYCLLSCSTSFN